MRYRRRNGPEFRCSWDEWLLSCQFLTSIQTFDSTGVRKDSATQVSGPRSQKNPRIRTLTPETCPKSKTAGPTSCRLALLQEIWPLLTFINHFLEFVCGSEFGDSTGSDLDGCTR